MTIATTTAPGTGSAAADPELTDPVGAVRDWLEENWDPELTVAEWWERLGLAGWSAPTLPVESYGRGLSRSDAVAVAKAINEFGALGAPSGLGLLLAAPTIVTHGTCARSIAFRTRMAPPTVPIRSASSPVIVPG